MPARKILQLGDPMLRLKSLPIASPRDALLRVRDLRATLHEFRRTHGFGRGISAVQIGELQRVIYLEFGGVPYTVMNPSFEWQSEEKFRLWDDCFSFPDLMVYVERSLEIRMRYQDEAGEWRMLAGKGALAELLQHEVDHLDGVLAVDRALDSSSLCTREEWKRRYRL